MCNLFASKIGWAEYVEAFEALRMPVVDPPPHAAPNLEPLEGVRPTDPTPLTVRAPGGVALRTMRWGFVQEGKRGPLTNFRSEGRRFAPELRCLVPCSYFFEFTGAKSPKTRWRFTRTDGEWLGFAGYLRPDENGGRWTLLTTAPGPDVAPIHDRQPVMLERSDWAAWFDGLRPEPELLRPSPAGSLRVEWDGGPRP
jgi:putative SOS response-associated peptidase YedK